MDKIGFEREGINVIDVNGVLEWLNGWFLFIIGLCICTAIIRFFIRLIWWKATMNKFDQFAERISESIRSLGR